MKKITLLIAFTAILFTARAQVITNGTFDTNIDGWISHNTSTLSYTDTEGANALGALQMVTGPSGNGNGVKTSPDALPPVAGDYMVTLKVKGTAGRRIAIAVQQGSTFLLGLNYTIKTTGVWEEHSQAFTGIALANMHLRILGREASTTYLIDDVNLVRINQTNVNSFVANSDFETGDLTSWSVNGPDIDASVVTDMGTNGSKVAQITYIQDQTTNNNELQNTSIYDFGEMQILSSPVSVKFDFNSSTANIKFAIQVTTFDATDAVIDEFFTSTFNSFNPAVTNEWSSVTIATPRVPLPFNKIAIRIRTVGGGLAGDKIAIDNIIGQFDTYTLGLKDKQARNNAFSLYPNPAQNILHIKSLADISSVSIYDVTGKRVLSTNTLYDGNMDVSSLKTGIYIITVADDSNNVGTKKLVISR